MDNPATWLDVVIASAIPITVFGILWIRIRDNKGFGVRMIQFAGVAMIFPSVLLLAMHHELQGEAVAAIFGSVVGYLLSNISKFDERQRDKTAADK